MALQGEKMSMKFSDVAISYMIHKAQADRAAALTSLTILLEHPAGIGDHSTDDLHKNLDEALASLADADDRIETINKYFTPNPPDNTKTARPDIGAI